METQEVERSQKTIKEIIGELSSPIPSRLLKTRKEAGQTLTYIEWHTAVRYLDHVCVGCWDYEVRNVQAFTAHDIPSTSKKQGNVTVSKMVITARITIHAADGTYHRESVGIDDLGQAFGDSATNAEAQALKRAASKFGLGLYLYGG